MAIQDNLNEESSDAAQELVPVGTGKRAAKGNTILGGLVWTIARTVGVALIQLGSVVIVSRQLTLSENGWTSAALVLSNLTTILSQIGIAPAIIQRPELENRHYATGFILSMVSGALQTLAVLLFAGPIARLFGLPDAEPMFRVISVIFVINAVSRIAQARLSRELQFNKVAQADLLSTVAYGIVAVSLAFGGFGAWSVIMAVIVQAAVRSALMMKGQPFPRPFRFDRSALRDLMQVARGLSISTILTYIAVQADNFIVGRWMGAASLGLYSRAYDLMSRPATMTASSVNRVLFPAMARKQSDKARLLDLYMRTTAGLAVLVLPLGLVCAVLAPEVILTLLGKKFAGSIVPFQILSAGMLFRVGFQSSDAITKALGDAYGRVMPATVYAGTVVIFGYLGTRWGLAGVATAVLIANALHTLLMARQSMRHLDLNWVGLMKAHKGSLVVALTSSVAALVTVLPMRHAHLPPPLRLVAGGLVAASICVALIWFGNKTVLDDSTVNIRDALRKRVLGKLKKRGNRATT